jgi:uncharacterized repeat protein (TIGR01451 family)
VPPAVVTTQPPPPPPPPTVGLPTGNLQAPPVYPDTGVPAAPPPVITDPPAGPPTTATPVPPLPAVDAQFAFPAPTIAQVGHPLVLTTLVTRRRDRVPLAGWTVRYEVASNNAGLSPTGGNRVEVSTDATGRASIEISPLTAAPGEAIVNMIALAPPELTEATSPPAEVARGTATITWRQGVPGAPPWAPQPGVFAGPTAAPSLIDSPPADTTSPPPPYSNDRTPNRFEPPPSLSDRQPPPNTYPPPPRDQDSASDQAPAGKPVLFVEVRRKSPPQVDVGELASFDVFVTNRGNAMARNINVNDRFDRGLTHLRAEGGQLEINYGAMRDLAPGETGQAPLSFGVEAAGELCHTVTVTADGAAEVVQRGCITAIDARPAARPTIEVTKQGPVRHYVGEKATFRTIIKNTGNEPVTNLVVVDRYEAALEPRNADSGWTRQPDDSFQWTIPLLKPGERRQISVECGCVAPSTSACSTVTVTADGGINIAEERCVEILPLPGRAPAAPGGIAPPPALPTEPLKVTLSTSANPARVGVPASLFVFVENVGRKSERVVALRVQLPREAPPIPDQIQPSGAGEMYGALEVRFNNVGEIGPGERRQFEIPFNAERAGVVTFLALVEAAGMNQPMTTESNPIQIEAASQ